MGLFVLLLPTLERQHKSACVCVCARLACSCHVHQHALTWELTHTRTNSLAVGHTHTHATHARCPARPETRVRVASRALRDGVTTHAHTYARTCVGVCVNCVSTRAFHTHTHANGREFCGAARARALDSLWSGAHSLASRSPVFRTQAELLAGSAGRVACSTTSRTFRVRDRPFDRSGASTIRARMSAIRNHTEQPAEMAARSSSLCDCD